MKPQKTTWIECRNTSQKGFVAFYMIASGKEYYLFRQKYRRGTWNFYRNGVRYEVAIDFRRANNDHGMLNAMKRIRANTCYLMKHEDVQIPERHRPVKKKRKKAA